MAVLKCVSLALYFAIFGVTCHDQTTQTRMCDSVPDRKINTAYLTIQTHGLHCDVTLMAVTSECYTCHLQTVAVLDSGRNSCTILVDTRWPMRLSIEPAMATTVDCGEEKLNEWFVERGNYTIFVTQKSGKIMCQKPILRNSPEDSNSPIYAAVVMFAGVTMLWIGIKIFPSSRLVSNVVCWYSSFFCKVKSSIEKEHHNRNEDAVIGESSPVTNSSLRRRKWQRSTKTFQVKNISTATNQGKEGINSLQQEERIKSLDTFRGISLLIMIFVNYGGGGYWFFDHAHWNGITIADVVMPWFVWITGTTMAFSCKSLLKKDTGKTQLFRKILKRSCIMFVLGLLINSSDGLNPVRLENLRIMGVLTRFALSYFVTATLYIVCAKSNDQYQNTWLRHLCDVADCWVEWVFNLGLVFLWLGLTFLFPVPGCPRGYLGPGGLANDGPAGTNVSLCTGGAAGYIERMVLGVTHIKQISTCKEIYDTTILQDPSGLLGTLNSCFICFLGLQAGKIHMIFPDWKARVKRFIIWGILLGIVTLVLCEGKKNGGFIPINKSLWSLSYVTCASSFAFFLFAFCYVTIDVYKIWTGAPFCYPGMNSIFVYIAHEVFQPYFPIRVHVDATSHWARLMMDLWGTIWWCIISYKMHLEKLYISI